MKNVTFVLSTLIAFISFVVMCTYSIHSMTEATQTIAYIVVGSSLVFLIATIVALINFDKPSKVSKNTSLKIV